MNSEIIEDHLICPNCRFQDLKCTVFEARGNEVIHGVVTCSECKKWYRLEDSLLELVKPELRDKRRAAAFRGKFKEDWSGWGDWKSESELREAEPHKWEQKDFFDSDAVEYENQMVYLPFWKAFDAIVRREIEKLLPGGSASLMLEIGGGTGRVSMPMRNSFRTVLSFDLSEAMVRTALQKKSELGDSGGHLHYFVADAENVPVRSSCADMVILSGILHHVENPDEVLVETSRVLAGEGRFFGLENNRSLFRPVFDLLMKVRTLWEEKAHEEHFILSGRELKGWFEAAGLKGRTWTSVYIPPACLQSDG